MMSFREGCQSTGMELVPDLTLPHSRQLFKSIRQGQSGSFLMKVYVLYS